MPDTSVHMPGGAIVLALLPLALLTLGLVAYAVRDLFRDTRAPYLPRWAWLIIVLASVPWGALVYLVVARDFRNRAATQPGPAGLGPPTDHPPVLPAVRVAGRAEGGPPVRTRGLTRDYGGAGLFDVDLEVPAGAIYGLVGPNGAGKTTVLSILTGTRRADRGEVTIPVPRPAVAVCPDVPEFEPWLTGYEVVDLARHYVAPSAGPEAVWWALRTAGLDDAAGRRVGGFSRGMTQRLGLAAALVGDPRLLLLDEPTSALDPAGRAEILDLVAAMRGHRTVIFSSHILSDVQRVADHVGVLRAGRLLYQGETQALIDRYLDPRWLVRVCGPVGPLAQRLRAEGWVRRVSVCGGDSLRVYADTMEHGERGIPRALADAGARLVSCEPLAADLESAFLALTNGAAQGGDGTLEPQGGPRTEEAG